MITANVGDKVRLTGYGLFCVKRVIGREPSVDEDVGTVEAVNRYYIGVRLPITHPNNLTGLWFFEDDEFTVIDDALPFDDATPAEVEVPAEDEALLVELDDLSE